MTEEFKTKLPKWPFVVGDVCLQALAWFIFYHWARPLELWQVGICFAAVALGAWIGIIPFLKEYQALQRMAEANALSTSIAQLQNIEQVKNQITSATAHWQFIQDQSKETVNAANEIAGRMKSEVREICAFLEKANDTERAHLRLEVEKLRRAEGEWLQVVVRILDHIFALNQAAARSGQPGLISQLSQFQHACRDAARRLGLIPFAPALHDSFDAKLHQLADNQTDVPSDAQITETLATGYSFQGHLVRKALVTLKPEAQPELPLASSTPERDSRSESIPLETPDSPANASREPVAAV